MEALSRMIVALAHHSFLEGFLVGDSRRDTITASHLLFTDVAFLFSGADLDQLKALKALLLCFKAIFS